MKWGSEGAPHLRFSPTIPHQTIAPSAHRPIETSETVTGCGFSACGEARPAAGWMGGAGRGQQQIISVGRIATPIGTGTVRLRGGNRSPRGSGWVGRARD